MSTPVTSTAEKRTAGPGTAARGAPDRAEGSGAPESTPDTGDNGTGTVAALGEPALLQGYRLAGAVLFPATGEAEIRAAWSSLPETVATLLLTPAAAEVLAGDLADQASPLTVVLPR